MNAAPVIRCSLIAGIVGLVGACSDGNEFPIVAAPTLAPTPVITPTAAPRNAREALAISDEDYDYAAVFANSGRGGF